MKQTNDYLIHLARRNVQAAQRHNAQAARTLSDKVQQLRNVWGVAR